MSGKPSRDRDQIAEALHSLTDSAGSAQAKDELDEFHVHDDRPAASDEAQSGSALVNLFAPMAVSEPVTGNLAEGRGSEPIRDVVLLDPPAVPDTHRHEEPPGEPLAFPTLVPGDAAREVTADTTTSTGASGCPVPTADQASRPVRLVAPADVLRDGEAPAHRQVRPPLPGRRKFTAVHSRAPRPSLRSGPAVPSPVAPALQEVAEPVRPFLPAARRVDDQQPAPESPAPSDDVVTALSSVREDDDAVVAIPAPAPMELTPRRHADRDPKKSRPLQFRRTVIPILLTLGVALPSLGGAYFALNKDSTFRASVSAAVAIVLLACGPVLLLLALLNMMQVRAALRSRHAGVR
jgi:hypothetical protein